MRELGWYDKVEEKILVVYRRKGERREDRFFGPIFVMSEDRNTLTYVPRQELPDSQRLDLTRVPVISIGGKRKSQPNKVRQFLANNPGFSGAFLLYPGGGQMDLGEGMIFLTSHEILKGKRVSGGRPEVGLTNFRWLRDGRWVADRARMLHGKVLETLETELEQEPGPDRIAEAITAPMSTPFEHRLAKEYREVASYLFDLERKRVLFSGEQPRNMFVVVGERIAEKIRNAGARRVADIPATLTVTAEEIAPELVTKADSLGMVKIPGLGFRLPERVNVSGGTAAVVKLLPEEVRQVASWPLDTVYPLVVGLDAYNLFGWTSPAKKMIKVADPVERWSQLREWLGEKWLELHRSKNYPKEQSITDPRYAPLPSTPEPIVWGTDLISGEERVVYAGLHVARRVGSGILLWSLRWFDSKEEAAKSDAEARRLAESAP